MLIFNIYAIRAIVSVVIVCTSLVAPPIVFLRTRRQLRLTGFQTKALSSESEVKSASNVQQVPTLIEGTYFSQSLLEKALLKPNDGFCGIKISLVVDLVNDSLSHTNNSCQQSSTLILSDIFLSTDGLLDQPSECLLDESLVCSNISLDSNLSESETTDSSLCMAINMSLVTFIPQPSVTTPLALFSPKQQFSLLAFLKWLRLYIRELILSSLPKPVSEWMVNNRITLGVICVSVMYGSLLTPLLYYFWTQVSAKNKLSKDLQAANSTQLFLDKEMSKLRQENGMITGNLSTTKNLVTLLEQEVSKTKLKLKEMQKSKNRAEIKLDCMASDLQNMEDEIERMEEEETEQRNTIEALMSKKSQLSQLINDQNKENFALCQQLDDLMNENTSLVETLSTLQEQYNQMEIELVEARQQTEDIQEELVTKNKQLVEQEKEIVELRECLSEVTHQTAQLATQSTDHLDMDTPTEHLISDVQIVLEKFEEPLEIDLEKSKDDDKILNTETILEKLSDENNILRQENAEAKAKITEAHEEFTKTQLNYKGVIEYLSSKEDTLRRELYNREAQVKEIEKLKAEAREKLQRRNEEFKKEKEEWAVTRNGLEELLKSLNSQVHINQDRAQRALEFVKVTEQKLRAADKEIITLKQTRLSQKRPAQQSRSLDTTKKSPVNSHSCHPLRPLTSAVRLTKEPVINNNQSSTFFHVRTKKLTQTQTHEQTPKATLIQCKNPSEVFNPFIAWSAQPNQALSEKSQRPNDQLEIHNNQQETHGDQQVKDGDQQTTCMYNDQEEAQKDHQIVDNNLQVTQKEADMSNNQEKASHMEEILTEHCDQEEVPSNHFLTDSTETSVADMKQDISTAEVISCSLSTGLTAESSPKEISSKVNAPILKSDHTVDSKPVISKKNKYIPRRSSPLLFASKSYSSSQSTGEDTVHKNVHDDLSTEEMTDSLIPSGLLTQEFEGIVQELDDCSSNTDSGVSVASEGAHMLGVSQNYTRTNNVAEVDGDSDSYYAVV